MNGVHDMGGMDVFGKVEAEPNEPMFHTRWEGRVYALSRVLLLLWLTIPYRLMLAPAPLLRLALAMLPISTAIFDYRENDAIAAMLAMGPNVDAETVARASFWTQAKSLGGFVTDAVCVTMAVVVFHRWWQRRYGAAHG